MPTLVLAMGQFSLMMFNAAQVPTSYWSAPVDQSWHITVFILQMLVLVVKVCSVISYRELWIGLSNRKYIHVIDLLLFPYSSLY